MKISNVEAMVLDTGKNYRNPESAVECHGIRFISLIKISTDAGMCGWADVETQPQVGKAVVDCASSGVFGFESLKHLLIGEDPFEHERLWQKMYTGMGYYGRQGVGMHMLSGANNAIWDIMGKALELPVHTLMGGKYRDQITAYASTLFRPNKDSMKKAVEDYVSQGFQAIKFGWGAFGENLKTDISLLRAAREAAGPDIGLMADAGWYRSTGDNPFRPRSIREWIILIQAMEELDFLWLEDFLPPENIAGYAKIAEHCKTVRLAAGEQYSGIHEFKRLAEEGHIDLLQPDLSRCGGLSVGRKIADYANEKQIECCPHAWLTDILKAASLHLSAYLQQAKYLEFNTASASLLNQICLNPIVMRDGQIEIPQEPGLGVQINETVVKEFRIA